MLVVFQNYYSPIRHKLFKKLGKHIDLKVIYMHSPKDEGRLWKVKTGGSSYQSVFLHYRKLGPFIINNPFEIRKHIKSSDVVIFLDDLPTNLSLLISSLFLLKNKTAVWVEHVDFKFIDSFLKRVYRKLFSYLWLIRVDTVFYFSDMTLGYISRIKKFLLRSKKHRYIRLYTSGYSVKYINKKYQTIKVTQFKGNLIFGIYTYFNKRKNLIRLVETFVKYHENFNNHSKLLIAGDGNAILKDKLLSFAREYPYIKVLPYLKNEKEIAKFLGNIHFLVFPSIKDPWGLITNESLVHKTLVLTSKYIGSSELVQKISPDLIFDPLDEESFLHAFNYAYTIMQKSKLYNLLINKSFDILKEYTIDNSVRRISRFFSVLSDGK